MFILDKSKIVDKILPLLSDFYSQDDADYANLHNWCMRHWWRNRRPRGGLSLTHEGEQAFDHADLESYDFEYGQASYLGGLAAASHIDRKLPCPHYVYAKNKRLYVKVYDSRVAMTIALYDTVNNYLSKIDPIYQGE